ncbi:MAG: glutamate racemase [Crocinitomicaceae bacterium]|nr:glutamate racemase [Crocinitomicaceae bacterium]
MGPIGVFDSGYGGLTILSDFRERLPEYDYLYLGDNARAPYGGRSFDVVYEFTLQAVNELFDRGCELVILACNTASAKALRTIQKNDLPRIGLHKRVLGVIRPSAEIIGQFSRTNTIGVLATPGTVTSDSYPIEIKKFSPQCNVFQHACPLWVTLIENNEHFTESGKEFIRKDVDALMAMNKRIDTIVLGCTHYPVLKDYIESLVPEGVNVVAQGNIVSDSLADYLLRHPWIDSKCTKNGSVNFLTSENSVEFNLNAKKYIDVDVKSVHISL